MIERLFDKQRGVMVHYWGSNFFVEPDNTCVENEYQAEKTHDLRKKAEILTIADPNTGRLAPGWAKKLGQKVDMRPGFEDEKIFIMRSLVLRKALDHPEFVDWLLETGNDEIVEGNYWHDNFWGQCWCKKCDSKTPQNQLGKTLMAVRAVIVEFDG